MPTRKTDAQINAEVAALRRMRPKLLRFSKFGDDHHGAMDAVIAVLEGRLTLGQVHAGWGAQALGDDDFDQHIFDEAMGAHDWMTGERSGDGPPSGYEWFGSLMRELVR